MRTQRRALLPLAVLAGIAATLGYFYATGRTYEEFEAQHGHAHHAPHGGTLILLGDHAAHIELVHQASAGQLTAFLLDGHAEYPVRSEAAALEFQIRSSPDVPWSTITLAAVANPLSGETIGDTSEFSGSSEALAGIDAFQLRTPPLRLRGVDFAAVETTFPEGNE